MQTYQKLENVFLKKEKIRKLKIEVLDLSLVLSSRFELTTLSRKAAVGFSLHFNEKFALLGGIRAAQ